MNTSVDTGRARAWAWIAHLRAGGTTPWRSWSASDAARPRAATCPAPSSSSCCAGSTWPAAPRPAGRAGAGRLGARSRPARPRAGGRRRGAPVRTARGRPRRAVRRRAAARGDRAARRGPRRHASLRRPDPAREPRRFRTRYELAGDPWLAVGVHGSAGRRRPPARRRRPLGARARRRPAHDARAHLGRRARSARAPRAGRTSWPGCGPGGDCPAGSTCPVSSSGSAPGRTPAGSAWCSTSASCPGWSAYAGSSPCPTCPPTPPSWPARSGPRSACSVLPAEQAALLSAVLRPAAGRRRRRAARRPAGAPGLGRGRRLRPAAAAAARSLPCGGGSGPGCCRGSGSPADRDPACRPLQPDKLGRSTFGPRAGDRAAAGGGDDEPQGPPPRRYAEDRHVVPPGRAVPQPRDARGRRHRLSGHPLRQPLPRRARPDEAAVGRAAGRGDRRVGRARRARCASTTAPRSSATRSSRPPRARRSAGRWSRSAHGDGTEVHLVLSVRDLVRQIPAEWQENVKHRAQLSYGAFLDQIRDPERATRIGAWFWGVQEIPEILDRWGQDLPPEHVHLVTVPPPGGAPELLWKRFSQAFGLDGIDLDLEAERHNPSLGRTRDHAAAPDQPAGERRARPGRLPAAGPRAARAPDPVAADELAAARAAARPAPVGAGGVGVVDRRDRGRVATTWSATSTTSWGRRRSRSTPTRTTRASARSPRPASTRSRRCCSTTPGSGTRRSGCTAELADVQGGAGAGLRDAVVPGPPLARAAAREQRRRAARCWGSTGGRAAGARGRRSGRPSRST